ncbi:unnamed protein product [Euphydryas editha]|uniref:(+)RNA virus helicase C-terminal domain-containing protein n=1 Tax=Euphydryas editha TaxID=104508 RepID=A0AAU9V6V2_EUPED|nr:unnamed protein product [Euphydryas editha]
MDSGVERIGICFCRSETRDRLVISPGLALLIKGSTQKTTIKRTKIEALEQEQEGDSTYRLVRLKNKLIVLFEWGETSAFAQSSVWLQQLSETPGGIPGRISVDSMRVGYDRGDVSDRPRSITPSPSASPAVDEPAPSGSERLQLRVEVQKAEQLSKRAAPESRPGSMAVATFIHATISPKQDKLSHHPSPKKAEQEERQAEALNRFTKDDSPRHPKASPAARTRADMGQVSPPRLRPASTPLQHAENALIEFLAITKANREVSLAICNKIMQTYRYDHQRLLEAELEEAQAAIYNSETRQVLKGKMSGTYMAAYNSTAGFVSAVESEGKDEEPQTFETPEGDPVVVVARCTKVMLGDRILQMAKTISNDWEAGLLSVTWGLPSLEWINGVPGCGKTTRIVRDFDEDTEVVITTTVEAAKDLKEKLAHHYGNKAKQKVRTMASVLVNGFREGSTITRLTVDEALMNHFGAIVMAARLSGAEKVILVGDINQLPYIDRDNLFEMRYCRPTLLTTISCELSCTHRNPKDVAFAISEVYGTIYSSSARIRSLRVESLTGAHIPVGRDRTLYLVFTQDEKRLLTDQGYGSGEGSRVLTIHEAQGQTYEDVIVLQTKTRRLRIHDSVSHAVVAVTRHTNTCVYYTDDCDDAIGRFVARAAETTEKEILEHSLKMAIHHRDTAVIESVLDMLSKNIGART